MACREAEVNGGGQGVHNHFFSLQSTKVAFSSQISDTFLVKIKALICDSSHNKVDSSTKTIGEIAQSCKISKFTKQTT